jgi:hypothetical protein
MSFDTCASCRFVLADRTGSVCRREPPKPALVMTGQTAQGPVLDVRSMWPPVRMEWWCGEYRKMNGVVMPTAADERLLGAAQGTG